MKVSATCLPQVVQYGSLDAVKQALAKASKEELSQLNVDEQSLIFQAVLRKEGALDVLRTLLDRYGLVAGHVDVRGQTALHWLATTENSDCIRILLERGCRVDHIDALLAQTPLFYAAHHACASTVRHLLASRADPAIRDRRGRSPICWATSLEVCKALVAELSFKKNAKQLLQHALVAHRRVRRKDITTYLQRCLDALSVRGALSWVALDAVEGGAGQPCAYSTTMASRRDVEDLCALEDEFIEDHRRLLLPTGQELTETEFFTQIGLKAEAPGRRALVQGIARGGTQCGAVRHYTLACHALPHGKNAGQHREMAGYLYFRVCDNSKNGEDSDDDNEKTRPASRCRTASLRQMACRDEEGSGEREEDVPEAPVGEREDTVTGAKNELRPGYITISHIKVAHKHQRRGLATLLMCGALRAAERERGRRGQLQLTDMYLSVADKNQAARRFYEKLGFTPTDTPCEHPGWTGMSRHLPEASLGELSESWLKTLWPSNYCPSSPSSPPLKGRSRGAAAAASASSAVSVDYPMTVDSTCSTSEPLLLPSPSPSSLDEACITQVSSCSCSSSESSEEERHLEHLLRRATLSLLATRGLTLQGDSVKDLELATQQLPAPRVSGRRAAQAEQTCNGVVAATSLPLTPPSRRRVRAPSEEDHLEDVSSKRRRHRSSLRPPAPAASERSLSQSLLASGGPSKSSDGTPNFPSLSRVSSSSPAAASRVETVWQHAVRDLRTPVVQQMPHRGIRPPVTTRKRAVAAASS
eukprot:TRINITY_DN102363_c0_g1_i1.p1 TRINITY_DN102363_c0_g1~~TRINITY_DN102363_c0_g1_i1.p1  ORF type:complete len:758 (+),score=127.25 TRINITY_DN102363_c0_g1_i1:42-2315(+)